MARKTKTPTPAPKNKKAVPAKAKTALKSKAKPAAAKKPPVSKPAPKPKPKSVATKAKPISKAKASTKPKPKASPKLPAKVVKKTSVKSSPKKNIKANVTPKPASAKKASAAKTTTKAVKPSPAPKTAKTAKTTAATKTAKATKTVKAATKATKAVAATTKATKAVAATKTTKTAKTVTTKTSKVTKKVAATKATKATKVAKTTKSTPVAKVAKKVAAKAPAITPEPKPVLASKGKVRNNLRSSILAKRGVKASKPVAFSFDEVREIAKTTKQETTNAEVSAALARAAAAKAKLAEAEARPSAPIHIKAASLADILGFNPAGKKVNPHEDVASVPEKFRRYYKLLLGLRSHLTGQLDTHTEETLKRSPKDDSGDLSSYGQHTADAGTDTFDRDFALSLVSSEKEALSEVEAAIKRIKNGTYGICEVTNKPIARERLLAVPFTRNSAEAQKEIEKTRYRARPQTSLFGELGEEGMMLSSGSGDGDD